MAWTPGSHGGTEAGQVPRALPLTGQVVAAATKGSLTGQVVAAATKGSVEVVL